MVGNTTLAFAAWRLASSNGWALPFGAGADGAPPPAAPRAEGAAQVSTDDNVAIGLLTVLVWSVIASYSQEMTNKSMQGRVQSVANSLSSCLLMAVYLLMACLSEYFTIAHVYWFCSLLGLGALVLLEIYRQASKSNQVLGN